MSQPPSDQLTQSEGALIVSNTVWESLVARLASLEEKVTTTMRANRDLSNHNDRITALEKSRYPYRPSMI